MNDRPHPRRLQPIPEDERVEMPEKLSQTFLNKFSSCQRSGYLYLKYRGGAASIELVRGSLLHETLQRCTEVMVANDEPRIPAEVARDLLMEVSSEHPEWVIPPGEFDAVRFMVYHFAEHTVIDPQTVFGIEQMWELEIAGKIVRGKMDLILLIENMVNVRDYKSAAGMKTKEQWEKDFQSVMYDLMAAFGHTEDGLVLPGDVTMFMSEVVYPRFVFDGQLASRESFRDRIDLQDHKAYLIDLLGKVDYAFETGEFPAQKGSHCNECPAALECPLLATLRDGEGEIQTREDAVIAAEKRMMHQSESRRLTTQVRKWVDRNGELTVGDKELYIKGTSSKETNWESLNEAIQRSVELGEPFDLSQHQKTKVGSQLADRTVPVERVLDAAGE